MTEPLTEGQLATIRRAHPQVRPGGLLGTYPDGVCDGHYDYERWPCDAAALLAHIDHLTAERDAAVAKVARVELLADGPFSTGPRPYIADILGETHYVILLDDLREALGGAA